MATEVAATVLDSSGKAVSGATVKGALRHHQGRLTRTTAANGVSRLGNLSLSRYLRSTVFTVTGVTNDSSTSAPKANTDPDGGSTGTTITVNRR